MGVKTVKEMTDERANRYALRCLCITMLGFTLAWIMNLLHIFIVDQSTMNLGFGMALGLTILCILICKCYGLHHSKMKYVLLFFIIAITTVINVMLTYHTVILSVFPIIYACIYHDTKKMAVYTYGLTMLSIIISVFAGYNYGLCDANMALLTSEPLSAYITKSGSFALSQINPNPGMTLSLFFVFPRAFLCGVFLIICIHISVIIADSRSKEDEMRKLAEIDGMTGLYNKSKYLELVANPYTAEEKLAVIFWDVNGLKQINDTLGHEYGDQLIVHFSESIRQLTSAEEKAYRVGGDEFVMIMRGGDAQKVTDKIQNWQESIKDVKLDGKYEITASYGYACGAGTELEELIKEADEMMYENKRNYYHMQKENME